MTLRDLPVVLRSLFPLDLKFDDFSTDLESRMAPPLTVPNRPQEGEFLCWAAVTQAVLEFFQRLKSQCTIASEMFAKKCCGADWPVNCDKTCSLYRALNTHKLVNTTSGDLSLTDVKAELDAGRPVCVQLTWDGGRAHALVITRIDLSDGSADLDVWDPRPPGGTYTGKLSKHKFQYNGKIGKFALYCRVKSPSRAMV